MPTVLVIDDSRAIRAVLRDILTEMGFDVAEAADGQEALTYLQQSEQPRAAFVDWNMPVMDGYTFVRQVRADKAYADMPMMMVTTESELEKILLALDAGAQEYVMKPFDKEIIAQKLALMQVPLPTA